ncbi:hypothetical protein NDU88_001629 [Pleurodeles waltl]|uniref:Uncharacterized protein n=1 Tax=Pleurodeles waltl TaxID=8319 RepID=A0AAV7WMP8_PLEWA|nr:hypothetical protein NDU88_001629 [Pleurodeles waltl]
MARHLISSQPRSGASFSCHGSSKRFTHVIANEASWGNSSHLIRKPIADYHAHKQGHRPQRPRDAWAGTEHVPREKLRHIRVRRT